jgi:hypothetical protein
MAHNSPIETVLGRLDGRDCIYLDGYWFEDGSSTLTLEGSINGDLCGIAQPGRFISFILRFRGVLALKMVELDSCDWEFESSFDEVIGSEWVNKLRGKIDSLHRHYFVQTYDNVFDVVCTTYEFEIPNSPA